MNALETRKAIQRLLHVTDDGVIGTKSLKAFRDLSQVPDNDPWPEVDCQPISSVTFDERTEKNITTLHPKVQDKFRAFMCRLIPFMAAKGVVAKIISGNRTFAEQDALYAKGRTTPGPKVTNARGGYSNHNFGLACDVGLFKDGVYLTDSPLYALAGPIGEAAGLSWGGRWETFKDEPHFEVKTGLTLAQMREKVLKGESVV